MSTPQELKPLLLGPPRLTVAAAESMSCGRVQAALGALSGSSDYFLGGLTAYSLEQKVRHLGVDRAVAEPVDCVSAEVAGQMAQGACALFDANLGLATTGYAESPAGAAPFAWWALAHRRRDRTAVVVRTGRVECPGASRRDAQQFVAEAVIAELIAYLRGLRG